MISVAGVKFRLNNRERIKNKADLWQRGWVQISSNPRYAKGAEAEAGTLRQPWQMGALIRVHNGGGTVSATLVLALSMSLVAGDTQGNKKTRKTYMQELVVEQGYKYRIHKIWIPHLVRDIGPKMVMSADTLHYWFQRHHGSINSIIHVPMVVLLLTGSGECSQLGCLFAESTFLGGAVTARTSKCWKAK